MPENVNNPESKGSDKFRLGPIVDIIKAVGLIGGSLGSLTILFFWLGNAIVVARLRVYNLYGTVHYTEEYVKEAGFQFLSDVFTFFGRETLYGLFIIAFSLIFLLIPIGPYQRKGEKTEKKKREETWKKTEKGQTWKWFRKSYIDQRTRYGLFITMAIVVSFLLISDLKFRILSSNIFRQEDNLRKAAQVVDNDSFAFVPKIWSTTDRFKKEFYRKLVEDIEPKPTNIKEWLTENLSLIYPGKQINDKNLSQFLMRFKKDIDIKEKIDLEKGSEKFISSKSYQALLSIQLNPRLKMSLRDLIADTLRSLEDHLSVWLKSDVDISTFVVSPASYEEVNNRIRKLREYASNVLYFFKPANLETIQALVILKNLKTIHFCGFILSFSFWILIGLLIYLLFNISNFFRFKRWEQVYFLSIALFFLIIGIVVPNAYGKYKFEFRIQEVRPISSQGENLKIEKDSPTSHLNAMINQGVVLYTLGPTRDKEVIIAVRHSKNEAHIILLDKNAMKNLTLRPVQPGEIPPVINLLRKKI
jgi:hypothetical protein